MAEIDAVFSRVWAEHQDEFKKACSTRVDDYSELFGRLVGVLSSCIDEYDNADHSLDEGRVTVIDHGDYQGTQVFVVGTKGYQPSTYWATNTFYGSCSACDMLQSANDNDDEERSAQYMMLMMHMLQRMRKIT